MNTAPPRSAVEHFLSAAAAELIRREIARARGNEVCFIARVAEGAELVEPRVLARGHASAVLALVKDPPAGRRTLPVAVHPPPPLRTSCRRFATDQYTSAFTSNRSEKAIYESSFH